MIIPNILNQNSNKFIEKIIIVIICLREIMKKIIQKIQALIHSIFVTDDIAISEEEMKKIMQESKKN